MIVMRRSMFGGVADSFVAFVAVASVIVSVDQSYPHFPLTTEFLRMRLTLPNACFIIGFTILWTECFRATAVLIHRWRGILRPIAAIAGTCLFMTAIVWLYLAILHPGVHILRIVENFFLVALTCQTFRFGARYTGWKLRPQAPPNVIILGSGRRAGKAWRELRIHYSAAVNLLGFVDDRGPDAMAPDIAQRYLCSTNDLSHYLLSNPVQLMIVATPLRTQYDMTQRAISTAEAAGLRVLCLADSFTLMHGRCYAERASAFVELLPKDDQFRMADGVKRALDIVLAAAGLVLLLPVFLLIAVAIKLTSPGPVFFTQERFGYQCHRFRIVKFRSMVVDAPGLMAQLEEQNEADGPVFKIKNDPRVTAVGRVLRTTSLDELPQLINVLCGEMSLVGPRPMSVRDVSRFSSAQLMRRFCVRPGITGLWQVSGRSSLSFDTWIALDFRYIDEWSLGLDLKILARTVPVVLKRSGAA